MSEQHPPDTMPQPLDVVADFTSMLIHDLRGPLSSVLLNLAMFEGAGSLSAEEREDLSEAIAAAQKLRKMMEIAMDVASLGTGVATLQTTSTDLLALVGQVADQQASSPPSAEGIGELYLSCDPQMISKVVEQLLAVAAKFTREEGGARIRVSRGEQSARVEVVDGGSRLPDDLNAATFDLLGALEIRREHRTYSRGLGPVFCKLVIDAHGGDIGVEADPLRPDAGNVFWFELPLVAPPEAATA